MLLLAAVVDKFRAAVAVNATTITHCLIGPKRCASGLASLLVCAREREGGERGEERKERERGEKGEREKRGEKRNKREKREREAEERGKERGDNNYTTGAETTFTQIRYTIRLRDRQNQ
jgi:hypothetical protein